MALFREQDEDIFEQWRDRPQGVHVSPLRRGTLREALA
jgi:hypothetical protein